MSVPILLTVAALGGGYLALAAADKERPGVEAPAVKADTSAAPVGASPVVQGAADMLAVSACSGPATVGDEPIAGAASGGGVAELAPTEVGIAIATDYAGGGDPATTQSAPVLAPAQAPGSSAAVPTVAAVDERTALIASVYGSGQRISKRQESALLADYGTLAGMVW